MLRPGNPGVKPGSSIVRYRRQCQRNHKKLIVSSLCPSKRGPINPFGIAKHPVVLSL